MIWNLSQRIEILRVNSLSKTSRDLGVRRRLRCRRRCRPNRQYPSRRPLPMFHSRPQRRDTTPTSSLSNHRRASKVGSLTVTSCGRYRKVISITPAENSRAYDSFALSSRANWIVSWRRPVWIRRAASERKARRRNEFPLIRSFIVLFRTRCSRPLEMRRNFRERMTFATIQPQNARLVSLFINRRRDGSDAHPSGHGRIPRQSAPAYPLLSL